MVGWVGGVLVLLGGFLSAVSAGSLDLQELRDVQYSIQILDTPVSEEDKLLDESATATVMVNREGQRYRCSVPRVEEKLAEEEQDEAAVPDVQNLLRPLEEGPCIFKTKDWWTYEICYNRVIKQYHVENDRPVGAVMVLGVHSPERDSWEATNRTYQPQYYANGSNCDLTSRPRQTELRFVCNEAASVEFIGDIFEPQSCQYTIVVHTARLCSVPWLRPAAEATPLPIACSPLLPKDQFAKYQVYQQKKATAQRLADRDRRAKQAALLATPEGGESGRPAGEAGGAGGLLDLMGDNMADRLVGELHSLLDNALPGGLNVLNLKAKEGEESPAVEVEKFRLAEGEDEIEAAKVEKWDLVHSPHKRVNDPELQELIDERNSVWRKVHEAKKIVKKYTSQLHDTETFIKNENTDAFKNRDIIDKLEQTKKVIEKALVKAREDVATEEELAKDVSHKIVAVQKKTNLHEVLVWKRKLDLLQYKMESGPEQFTGSGSPTRFSNIVKELAVDYKKATGEQLVKIDDYFKYAKKFVNEEGLDKFEALRKFMQFANKDLAMMIIDDIKTNTNEEMKEFNKEVEEMSEKKIKVAKFSDIVKDDVREKFSDILKEVSDELNLPDGDVDQEEAMRAMSATLDQLVSKLAGSSDKMKDVQKQIVDLKKEVAGETVNLKRDGKRSVKKELREEDEPQRGDISIKDDDDEEEEEEDEEDEDAKLDDALAEAKKKLEVAEAEVEQLEKEWKGELPQKLAETGGNENLKVTVTKMGGGVGEELSAEQAAKLASRLEGTIKDKLAKLGIDTHRPIEVKLITTSLPEGLNLGEDGDPQNDQQVQSMFFNMMTGNIQGYEDIDSQRKAESSYKFNWNEDMMEDLDKRIAILGGDTDDTVVVEDTGDLPEEVKLTDDEVPDFMNVDDQRQRPSSEHSKIDSASEELAQDASEVKDEL